MSRFGNNNPRKPATKFPHLQKQLQKSRVPTSFPTKFPSYSGKSSAKKNNPSGR